MAEMILELQGHEIRAGAPNAQGPVGPVATIPMYPMGDCEGPSVDPLCYLTGSLSVAAAGRFRVGFYAEAIEVYECDNQDFAVSDTWETRLCALVEEYQNPFDTIEHKGRRYVVFITPQGL